MRIEELKNHPVLSQLNFYAMKDGKKKYLKFLNLIAITTKDFRWLFRLLCKERDLDNLRILLDAGYSTLFDDDYLLSKIIKMNNLGYQSISLLLQKRIDQYVEAKLATTRDMLDVANILEAVSLYQSRKTVNWLREHFSMREYRSQYDRKEYSNIFNALKNLAVTQRYFEFAAYKLLACAAKEIEINNTGGNKQDRALRCFILLFRNIGARTNASLEERLQFLSEAMERRDVSSNELQVLIKALGVATNALRSGTYRRMENDPYRQTYINQAIETLMKRACREDELSMFAQEELHKLLAVTIDELNVLGAPEVPYTIFRLYSHYKSSERAWRNAPISHLDTLRSHINFLERENNPDHREKIQTLERRLVKLESFDIELPEVREFIADDFTFYRGAKKREKRCEIGVIRDPNTALELHERQSLAECLIYFKTDKLSEIKRRDPRFVHCTYLIANFGLVVSDIPHEKNGPHKRVFKSIAVKIPETVINLNEEGIHAEEKFYNYFLISNNILSMLTEFKKQYNINLKNHKIYAVIFDLHGTYDMCISCSGKGLNFQNEFYKKFRELLPNAQMKTLTKYKMLPIIIRYSSDKHYDYRHDAAEERRGVLSSISEGSARDLTTDPNFSIEHDIKEFGANLLVHGKSSNWHALWSARRPDKRESFYNKKLSLEPWTAFVSNNEAEKLLRREQNWNYTRLGEVDTSRDMPAPLERTNTIANIDQPARMPRRPRPLSLRRSPSFG